MVVSWTATVAIEWTLVGLAFVFVCLRIYVRILRRQRPMLSDAFVVLAWMAFVPCCACDIRLYRLGLFVLGRTYEMALTNINEDPYKSIEALKIIYGSALPYYTDLWLIKASLLALYYELIPTTKTPVRRALLFVTLFTIASYIVVICLNAFYCQPIDSNWSLSIENQCINSPSFAVFFPSVITNIITDLMIFILPFFLLRKLPVSRRQLWGLVSLFSLGGIAILMSVARIVALAFSATTTQVAIWTALECSIGIIVACCPALRLLFRRAEDRTHAVMFGSGSQNLRELESRTASELLSEPLTPSETVDRVSADFELVEASHGQYIFKRIEFEIMSERHSAPPPPHVSLEDEMGWELAAKKRGL